MTQRGNSGRKILRIYVDETGDRGCSPTSSPFFAFAAVLVPDEDEPALRATVAKLRTDFNVPGTLHWSDHVRKYDRRQHTQTELGGHPTVRVMYVVVHKAAIPAGSALLYDTAKFYNYAAGFVLERALLAARDWPGGSRDAIVRFAHVRGFNHADTVAYFDVKARTGPTWIPWHLLSSTVTFPNQASFDGLQVADMYAGMLSAAIRPDKFGGYEPHHLLAVRPQLRRHPGTGTSWGFGFKLLGSTSVVTSLPWWPPEGL